MIKGIIITHGNLGQALIDVAERILEQKLDIVPISFDWQGDGSEMVSQVEHFLEQNRAHDVLIFTDMFGGSPANICTRFVGPTTEVLAGINLPGLLKFISYQNKKMDLPTIVKHVKEGALEGITVISEYLGEKQ